MKHGLAGKKQPKGHTMRSFTTGLLKGRIARWSMFVAVLAAAGLSLAWMGHPQYRLGGAFIGSGGGIIWTACQTPLDPAGRTAAIRVNPITFGPDFAGLLATFGADGASEFTGAAEMISRDTAKGTFMGYGVKQGNPPQVCLIEVYTWTLKFTGPDSFVVDCTCDVYPGPANILGLPNADADGDGFPDSGVAPVSSFPVTGSAQRVPLP
jgi:hypothetical protein